MIRSYQKISAVCSVLALASYAAPQAAVAQNLFLTQNRTIAGGNPLSGGTNTSVVVGADAANVAFPNVHVDITGGTITDYLAATNQSVVTISGGTIGQLSNGASSLSALVIRNGSTINLTGGVINSFVMVGPLFGDDGTVNTFNMSGGTLPYIFNNGGGVVNITGGSIAPASGFTQGVVGNYSNGTVNITGGTMNIVGNFGYGTEGVTNFGGTASTDSLRVFNGAANITGGTIGAGGVTVGGQGVANFTGSGLNVTSSGSHAFFDDGYYQNFIVADYSITGTLTSGTALNTTIRAGVDYTNTGTVATFDAPTLAPDLFVTTNQTVNSVYNNVFIGIDETFSNPADPTVTLADGMDTVELQTQSASVTTMTGGIIRDYAFVTENSQFNVTGGEIAGAVAVDDAAITVSGGAVGFLGADGNAHLTVSGGDIGGYSLSGNSALTFQGSGLSATGTTGHYWDGGTNYIAAGDFAVSGTLADGTALDQTILAGGTSGNGSQQTLVAAQAAQNLYLTENTTTNTIYNLVTVGQSADQSVNTSPTVTVAAGSDLGTMYVRNQSTLNAQGGVIRGTIFADKDTKINISDGTLGRMYQWSTGTGKITVSGGSTNYIAPRNLFEMTGGSLTTLDTYSGARVRIEGGTISTMLLFGSPSSVTDVLITGGSVGLINFQGAGSLVNIQGGSVGDIWGSGGTAVNIYGGTIGANTLLNFRTASTRFNIFGSNLLLSDATLGTYTDNFGNAVNGAWWNLTGTLQSGTALNTRYFERGGIVSGPTSLVLTAAAAPEPGTLALAALALLGIGLAKRQRSRFTERS